MRARVYLSFIRFPFHIVWNLLLGYSVRDTVFLYRLAWRIERTGRMF